MQKETFIKKSAIINKNTLQKNYLLKIKYFTFKSIKLID